ncbi:MAG: adenylyl-sulfate kinase [Acidiferrobacterales bacterium]
MNRREFTSVASSNTVWHNATVTRERRENRNKNRGAVVWFTGLSGAGKSTIAHSLEEQLFQTGCLSYVFDGDNVRHGLCSDLGFSAEDRTENIRRIAEMCKLFVDAGVIALTAFISPLHSDREMVRKLMGKDFIEVYCRCPVEVCEQRDVKGLYKKARAGEIKDFTGISAPYEAPENPDLAIDTDQVSLEESIKQVMNLLIERQVIKQY